MYKEIDEHIKNSFNAYNNLTELSAFPSASQIQMGKTYVVPLIAISTSVVDYRKIMQFSDPEIARIVMYEYTFGVSKVLKHFGAIKLQYDDGVVTGVFKGDSKPQVDSAWDCACALNAFKMHLRKKINNMFASEIVDSPTNIRPGVFNFGIGLDFSFDNYVSILSHDGEMLYSGAALVNSVLMANAAGREGIRSIILSELVKSNLTAERKVAIYENGGVDVLPNNIFDESPFVCFHADWISTQYVDFINKN